MRTDDFDYDLPEQAIAQTPIEPRDAARLLRVADLSDHRVADLPQLLQPGDVLVVNSTRVRSARLAARRATGGRVEVLLLDSAGGRTADPDQWDALVRPARRLRAGEIVSIAAGFDAEIISVPVEGRTRVRLIAEGSIESAIIEHGQVPLPPYIGTELEDDERYQTVFARDVGSAAAPTAGLHFTEELLTRLRVGGVAVVEIELRVGLDTFRPVTAQHIEDHEIHTEWCRVSEAAAAEINERRAVGGRVVAVGTTVARTVETFARVDGTVDAGERATDLYITPGYRFRTVEVLMTNFHVPRSSLLMMVAAFSGDRWRRAYAAALGRGYRFLSFGDAMLLERERAPVEGSRGTADG